MQYRGIEGYKFVDHPSHLSFPAALARSTNLRARQSDPTPYDDELLAEGCTARFADKKGQQELEPGSDTDPVQGKWGKSRGQNCCKTEGNYWTDPFGSPLGN